MLTYGCIASSTNRLLDQGCDVIRLMYYSYRIEQTKDIGLNQHSSIDIRQELRCQLWHYG